MPEALTPAQQRLVERVAPRVVEIARAVRSQVGTLSVEDFTSAGYEALVKAALRYDPTTGVPFAGFAYLRVRGAMLDAVRAANPAIRQHRRAVRALAATQALYEEEQRRADTSGHGDPRSLAERVQAATALIEKTAAAVLVSKLSPADPEISGDPSHTAADEVLIATESKAHLREALETCSAEERALIDALYFRGINMHAYAAELSVAVSTISRRHRKLLGKLAGRLRATDAPQPAAP